jgi:hypothetical protein
MTLEERARSCIYVAKGGISFAGIDERVLIPSIVEALRTVRREALEEAAKVAETPVEDDDRIDRQVRWDVATQIRSLSEDKEGG